MRLSPVFVAVFGLTATVGLSNSANAQTSPVCANSQEPLNISYDFHLDWLLPQSATQANFSPVLGLSETEGEITFCENRFFSAINPTLQTSLEISLNKAEVTQPKSLFVGQEVSEYLIFNKIKPSFPSLFPVSFNQSDFLQLKLFSLDTQDLQSVQFESVFAGLENSEELALTKSKSEEFSDEMALNKLEEEKPEFVELAEELALTKSKSEEFSDEMALNKLEEEKPEFVEPAEELALNKSKSEEFSDEMALNKLEEEKPEFVESAEELALNKSKSEEFSDEMALNKLEEEKPEFVEPAEELALTKSKSEEFSDEMALNKLEEEKPEFVEPAEELALNKSKSEEFSDEMALNKLEEEKLEFVESAEELALNKSKSALESNSEITLYKIEAEQTEPVLFDSEIQAVSDSTQTQSSQLGEPLEQQSLELAQASPEGEPQPEMTPEIEPEIAPENTIPEPPPTSVPEPVVPVPPPPSPTPRPSQNAQPEAQVLVAEVVIEGTDDPVLEERVYNAISTVPGRTTTRSQLQQDINAIFALGFFRNVRAIPEDTPLGVRITFEVEANPSLEAIIIEGDSVLPPTVVEESFAGQFNRTINLNEIEEAIQKINTWYQENGYVLAQVIEAPEVTPDGTVTLVVAEGEIENIRVRFLSSEGEQTDEEGNPIEGKTQDYIITREIELEAGDVFNQRTAQQDLSRVFGLGIFEDVRLQLEPGEEDPRKAVMIVNVVERSTGSLVLGGGVSSATGLFGTVSYQELNINGRNQRLGSEVQLGERIVLLDISFTDPWIDGDPYRTSYTANIFRRQAISVIFEQDDEDDNVRLPNGDRPRVVRTGGGITFTRPFAENVFTNPDWVASVGLQYQHVQIADADLTTTPRDDAGKLLSESSSGEDDLLTVQFGIARDRRNNQQFPTSGYAFRFGTEQAVPVGSGSISFNRLRATYSYYLPVQFLELVPGGPQTIAFNFQAGTMIGDFPPYEAFALGGANTVRGWREGHLGAARSFVLASIEYRFPVLAISNFIVGGAVFIDGASALGTQSTVPGNPGGIRGKPGSGLGVGAGLRIQSPLGPIRIDYGVSDEGEGRIHFGVGERF
ncbi:BamA/TamA family outer membrane protein [Limnoraphis robusta]|uniref:BamA/TamA family outer membrane protein n=1 Tax=Limnoraphis robusta TaxID=1118279 RepID=UPI002B200B31|nr:BamA/TamA family outer membrane protein [Limnoraphis robusta]MEA5500749.1 BamA/TamA family outer membrane protein [Limnoraphis robusta BA-68 BA1]